MNDYGDPTTIEDLHMLIMHRNPVMPNPSRRGINDATGRSYATVKASAPGTLNEACAMAQACQEWWREFCASVPPMVPVWWRLFPGFVRPGESVLNPSTDYWVYARLDAMLASDGQDTQWNWASWLEPYKTTATSIEVTDFGWALKHLRDGDCVRRKAWVDEAFIYFVAGSSFKVNRPPLNGVFTEGTEVSYMAHIDMRHPNRDLGVWGPTMEDLIATDWELYVGF